VRAAGVLAKGRMFDMPEDTDSCKVKVMLPRKRPEGSEGGRGIALLFCDLGARRGCVVSIMPRPLYSRESLGTPSTGGWVDPRAGLDLRGKFREPIFGPSSP
jgi:hypothetical protein